MTDVRDLYEQCGYGGGLKSEDVIFLARMHDRLVGAVRLCPEMNVFVLGGMQVLPSFQRQGIGTKLLKVCDEYLGNRYLAPPRL